MIEAVRAFPGLTFNAPVALVQEPSSAARWYVAKKTGNVYWFNANDNATAQKMPFINLTKVNPAKEGGLLGIAFHPDYATNGYVFLSFTTNNANSQFASQISRFRVNAERTALDRTSELMIMQIPKASTYHNGGNIAFGPDGYLYFGLGDGTGANGPANFAQNTHTLPGTLLRIDVNDATADSPYKIPSGNPFSGSPTCPKGMCPDQTGRLPHVAGAAAARKFSRGVCATRGAGVLTGSTAICGPVTWERETGKKSISLR